MPTVSIIMPVYNSQLYLNETINSIVNQSFDNFELICIDDGSTDDSLKILKEYERNDSRIKIISQKNKGAGAARNIGLKSSLGEYILFIDSDDYITDEFLKKAYNNITSNDSDMVIYKIGEIENNKKVKNQPYFPFDKTFENADFNNFTFNYKPIKRFVLNEYFAPWTKFYRKEFLKSHADFLFDEELPYEDILFHIKTMLRASKISFVPDYLYYYRLDTIGSCTSNDDDHGEIFKVVDQVGEFLRDENRFDEFEKEYEYFKLTQITRHISDKNDEDYFKKAKVYLKNINADNNDAIPLIHKKQFQIFFDSENAITYNENINTRRNLEKIAELKNTHEKLVKENKKLKKMRKKEKAKKQQLANSNSWKITRILRKFKNR